MLLLETECRNWRGLSRTLGPLSPRLNVILGPNESGKSRLFQCMQYVLFEPHKGTAAHKRALQNWIGADMPFGRVAFNVNGVDYELQKQFLKNPMAQLSGGGQTLRGDDAEEAVRTLLGTRQVGSNGARPEDLGIWPVVMMAQGGSRRSPGTDITTDGRVRLQERLAVEIGVAAISVAGQAMMQLAHAEYLRWFQQNGIDGSDLKTSRALVEKAKIALSEAQTNLDKQAATAEALTRKREEQEDLNQRLQRERALADQARQNAELAAAALIKVTAAEGTQRAAEQVLRALESERQNRAEADGAMLRLGQEVAVLQESIDVRAPAASEKEAEMALARVSIDKLRETLAAQRKALSGAQQQRRRADLTRQKTAFADKIERLNKSEDLVKRIREQRAAIPKIDAAAVDSLRKLDGAVQEARARLQGSAVSVTVEMLEDARVDGVKQIKGSALNVEIVEDTAIQIGEVARVRIRPGAGDLGKLRDAVNAAEVKLTGQLERYGVKDLRDAVVASDALAAFDGQINQILSEVKMVAEGKSVAQLREDAARIAQDLDRLGPMVEMDVDEATLERAVAQAENDLAGAHGAAEALQAALTAIEISNVRDASERSAKQSELDRLKALYSGRPDVAALDLRIVESSLALDQAGRAVTEAKGEYADRGGEQAQADAAQARQAVDGLQRRVQDTRTERDRLQGVLQTMLETGSYDVVQGKMEELERFQQELARKERQAAAAKLLWTVLSEERSRVVEQLTAPVVQRVQPYLKDIFPGSSLSIGENLEFSGLLTGNVQEHFDELSGGAQEQLSLLARIGLAEVLAGEGRLPLVLDDALINTDPERIRRVHRALFRAAGKLQVVLFSCHDRLLDGLGADLVVTLDATRV